jgi:hypothetical protein
MPTKRCCCGICYEYTDAFQRDSNDETLLEDHWEVCDVWTDWEINPTSPAFTGIVSRASDSKMILLEMVGNPYGILTATIEADTEGQKFRIYAFHGSQATPCGSPSNNYAEIEVTSTGITQRIVVGGDEKVVDEVTPPTTQLIWTVCMGDKLFESSVSGGATQRHCGEPSGHYFGIGAGSATVTKWQSITYSDHWLHNRSCPRCGKSCCFPSVNRTIGAFYVTISNIGSGDCGCASTTGRVLLTLATGVGLSSICSCSPRFEAVIPGPHDCPEETSVLRVAFDCDQTDGSKGLNLQIIPDDGGANEWDWTKSFDSSALPEDIRIDNDYTSSAPGDEGSCKYEFAVITVEPVIVQGCCDEVLEETSLAIHEVRAASEKINELPYEQHEAVIAQLRDLTQPGDKGLGDTATRVLGDWEQPELSRLVRCWLRFYSCRRSEALKMVNRHFPYPDRSEI